MSHANVAGGSKDFRDEGFGFSAALVARKTETTTTLLATKKAKKACALVPMATMTADVVHMDPEIQVFLDEFKTGEQECLKIAFDRDFSRIASRMCQGIGFEGQSKAAT